MDFGALVSKVPAGASIVQAIRASGVVRTEVAPLTPTSWVRASGLGYLCPREEVLAARLNRKRTQEVSPDDEMVFAHGHGLHWTVQNKLLAPRGILVGQWRCLLCGRLHGGATVSPITKECYVPRPTSCACGAAVTDPDKADEVFVYREQQFKDPVLMLSGHPDGFLRMPSIPEHGVLEIKSIGARSFAEVQTMPLLEHIVQLHAYFRFTGFRWGIVLYWEKGSKGLEALVEHYVRCDDRVLRGIETGLAHMRAGLAGGPIPLRVCDRADDAIAKRCPMADTCFDARWTADEVRGE